MSDAPARRRDKFRGCLLGAVVGDVAGAVVEGESPGYIAREFRTIDDILSTGTVEEFTGPPWRVGRFTDDTQMMLCVAEWLLAGEVPAPQRLLERFADAFEPWRRYGPGTSAILQTFPEQRSKWRELATMQFPHGSYGNGSAMRVAPVGLAFSSDVRAAASVAIESSRPTHSHPLAYQGAVLQSVAVGIAVTLESFSSTAFLSALRNRLAPFDDLMQDTSKFQRALAAIEDGLGRGAPCAEMSDVLGTGVDVFEAVPMALYCSLRHPDSYADVIHDAVFIGGDTDTIASMAGAVSGALLGKRAIPPHWIEAIREETFTAAAIEHVADRLFDRFGMQG